MDNETGGRYNARSKEFDQTDEDAGQQDFGLSNSNRRDAGIGRRGKW